MTSATVNLVLIVVLLCFVYLSNCNVIINTSSGKVAGKEVASILINEKYYSFLGIPYAQTPVGSLRFMPPVPHPGWKDTLEAKKERASCAQFALSTKNVEKRGFSGEEDCLYLSIHTPKLPLNDDIELPVIVFIYSENFKVSHNGSKDYGPDFFMAEDIILVTVQHRLGVLGFLSFEDDLLPGNNGLRDIIIALEWLKENIHNFGGNPNKITLMGSQSGAALVDVLLHSPRAKGLFSAAILQSGTSWSSMNFGDKAREKAIEFAKYLKQEATTSSSLLKCLANVTAEKLSESEHVALHSDGVRKRQIPDHPFGTVVEHEHPAAVISSFPENNPIDINIPVMIGYNSREGIERAERYLRKPMYLTFADRHFLIIFPVRVQYKFQLHSAVLHEAIQEIKDFYFDEGYVKVSQPGEYITYIGDILTMYPIDYTVRKYTNESMSRVYYYMFDYSGDLNMRKKYVLEDALNTDGTWGATLGDELCYLFVCNPIRKIYKKALKDEDSEEIKVLRNMIRLWTNFAKTGNPTPQGDEFTWRPASKENKQCLVISDELQMKSDLNEDKVKFWDEFLAKYEKMAVDGVVKDVKDEL